MEWPAINATTYIIERSVYNSNKNYGGKYITGLAGPDYIVHLTGLNILKSCIHYMSNMEQNSTLFFRCSHSTGILKLLDKLCDVMKY